MKKKQKDNIKKIIFTEFQNYENKDFKDIFKNIKSQISNQGIEFFYKIINKKYNLNNNKIKNKVINDLNLKEIFNKEDIEEFFKYHKYKLQNIYKKDPNIGITKFLSYKKVNERDLKSIKIISDIMSKFYQYVPARKLNRKIIYHMGPTNSGKTYASMRKLESVESGCYLAPLRLLAWEKYEELSEKKITALITGEESIKPEGYTHTASTIEMANYNKVYDVAVIDEIQMIADEDRGWGWTKALLNIQAKEVHLCGDASCLNLIKKLLELTGETLEEKTYTRKTKLSIIDKVISEDDIQKGDALIVFSRKEVLNQKHNFEKKGLKVSVIYGMLSPEIRKRQAQMFLDGETDIVISTDAIGMGLNLPIKRIVFSTLTKYYNKEEHFITHSEIKQIAGRAGRYKIYDEGFVCLLDQAYNPKWNYRYVDEKQIRNDNINFLKKINQALSLKLNQKTKAIIGPDFDTLNLLNGELFKLNYEEVDVLEFLMKFNAIELSDEFKKMNLDVMIDMASEIQMRCKEWDDLESIFKFCIAPVMIQIDDHKNEWIRLFSNYYGGIESKHIIPNYFDSLQYLEIDLKCIELYQWLSNQFNELFVSDPNEIKEDKDRLIEKINKELIK